MVQVAVAAEDGHRLSTRLMANVSDASKALTRLEKAIGAFEALGRNGSDPSPAGESAVQPQDRAFHELQRAASLAAERHAQLAEVETSSRPLREGLAASINSVARAADELMGLIGAAERARQELERALAQCSDDHRAEELRLARRARERAEQRANELALQASAAAAAADTRQLEFDVDGGWGPDTANDRATLAAAERAFPLLGDGSGSTTTTTTAATPPVGPFSRNSSGVSNDGFQWHASLLELDQNIANLQRAVRSGSRTCRNIDTLLHEVELAQRAAAAAAATSASTSASTPPKAGSDPATAAAPRSVFDQGTFDNHGPALKTPPPPYDDPALSSSCDALMHDAVELGDMLGEASRVLGLLGGFRPTMDRAAKQGRPPSQTEVLDLYSTQEQGRALVTRLENTMGATSDRLDTARSRLTQLWLAAAASTSSTTKAGAETSALGKTETRALVEGREVEDEEGDASRVQLLEKRLAMTKHEHQGLQLRVLRLEVRALQRADFCANRCIKASETQLTAATVVQHNLVQVQQRAASASTSHDRLVATEALAELEESSGKLAVATNALREQQAAAAAAVRELAHYTRLVEDGAQSKEDSMMEDPSAKAHALTRSIERLTDETGRLQIALFQCTDTAHALVAAATAAEAGTAGKTGASTIDPRPSSGGSSGGDSGEGGRARRLSAAAGSSAAADEDLDSLPPPAEALLVGASDDAEEEQQEERREEAEVQTWARGDAGGRSAADAADAAAQQARLAELEESYLQAEQRAAQASLGAAARALRLAQDEAEASLLDSEGAGAGHAAAVLETSEVERARSRLSDTQRNLAARLKASHVVETALQAAERGGEEPASASPSARTSAVDSAVNQAWKAVERLGQATRENQTALHEFQLAAQVAAARAEHGPAHARAAGDGGAAADLHHQQQRQRDVSRLKVLRMVARMEGRPLPPLPPGVTEEDLSELEAVDGSNDQAVLMALIKDTLNSTLTQKDMQLAHAALRALGHAAHAVHRALESVSHELAAANATMRHLNSVSAAAQTPRRGSADVTGGGSGGGGNSSVLSRSRDSILGQQGGASSDRLLNSTATTMCFSRLDAAERRTQNLLEPTRAVLEDANSRIDKITKLMLEEEEEEEEAGGGSEAVASKAPNTEVIDQAREEAQTCTQRLYEALGKLDAARWELLPAIAEATEVSGQHTLDMSAEVHMCSILDRIQRALRRADEAMQAAQSSQAKMPGVRAALERGRPDLEALGGTSGVRAPAQLLSELEEAERASEDTISRLQERMVEAGVLTDEVEQLDVSRALEEGELLGRLGAVADELEVETQLMARQLRRSDEAVHNAQTALVAAHSFQLGGGRGRDGPGMVAGAETGTRDVF